MINNAEELKDKNIKYILSIGKRQPMHVGHKRSLERILALKEMELVYVIGSSNLKGDPLFDPIVNPLTVEQQKQQFREVFPDSSPIFIAIKDVPDMSKWGDVMIDSLAEYGIKPEECAIHFIGKQEDKLSQEISFDLGVEQVSLKKGQWLIEALSFWGFTMWFDEELKSDLSISARNLRNIDLLAGDTKLFAAPEYLKELAVKAREGNSEAKDKPITLYDLSLERMKG